MKWFANEEFWSLFYEWMFPPESFKDAKNQVEDIKSLVSLDSGNVLDLCCGPGRHSVPFGKLSFNVTSVDLNTFLLQKAKNYAKDEGVEIEFVKKDMRKFFRKGYFNLVLSLYSSFGYFENRNDDLKVLNNIYLSLKKGGFVVLDLRGKEIHALTYKETVSYELPSGDLIFQRNRTTDNWSVCRSNWVYIKEDRAYSYELILNLYSGVEMINLLKKVGFSKVDIYGSLKGCKYDNNSQRLIVIGLK